MSWLIIGDGNSLSVYNESDSLTSSLDWNRATAYKESNLEKQIFSKSKDMDSTFCVVFSSSKAEGAIDRGEEMTHWLWPQFMTHGPCSTCSISSQIKKDGMIQISPVAAINRLKEPPTGMKVTTTLANSPTPTHTGCSRQRAWLKSCQKQ